MSDPSDIGAILLAVGELKGKVGELVHQQGNMAQKIDLLTEKALLAPTMGQIEALTKRVDGLEAERDRQDGAKGVLAAVMRSPVAAWGAAIIAAIWGAFKGGLLK